MQKKYPLIFLLAALSVALYYGDVLRLNMTSAQKVTVAQSKASLFQDVYQTLELEDIAQARYKLAESKKPIIILNFWASWCSPCLREIPSLVELKKNFSEDQLSIFAINSDDDDKIKAINKTMERFGADFINIADDGSIVSRFNIVTLPFTIIFSNGKVIFVGEEEIDFASKEIIKLIRNSLKD